LIGSPSRFRALKVTVRADCNGDSKSGTGSVSGSGPSGVIGGGAGGSELFVLVALIPIPPRA
jgi:hypothetical protein